MNTARPLPRESSRPVKKPRSLNWILPGIIMQLMVVAAGIWFAFDTGDDAPLSSSVTGGTSLSQPAPPALPVVPPPEATEARLPPTPVPDAMVKIASAARDTPMDRPINQTTKSWLGCHSKSNYQTAIDRLMQHNPASALMFQGTNAPCEALASGIKVTLAMTDQPDHLVQVRLDSNGELLWTDPSAVGAAPAAE